MVGFNPFLKKVTKKDVVPQRYEELAAPHVDSFNFFLGEGLKNVINNLDPITVRLARKLLYKQSL
jgi:hypothetical protein